MKKRLLSLLLAVLFVWTAIPVARAETTKLAALTFDDGPGPYTDELLDGLRAHGAKATFFCTGTRGSMYPDQVRRILAEGHQLGNHSYDHANLGNLPLERALGQLARTDEILNKTTGGTGAHFYRAPYGNSSRSLRESLDAPLIHWTVDTVDWQVLNAEKVKNNILNDIFDGAIVLLHDIHHTSVQGVLAALDTLEERGYELVTVKELFRRRGVAMENGVQYFRCKPTGTDLGPVAFPELSAVKTKEGLEITLTGPADMDIYYTVDGTPVTYGSSLYEGPFSVSMPVTIRAVAAWDLNGGRSEELTKTYTLPPAGEPFPAVENGKLTFQTAAEGEEVYVSLADGEEERYGGPVDVEPTTWFTYYAGGEGLQSTEKRTLLFTAEGNLFADVPPEAWYYEAMDRAAAKGYLQGSGRGRMDPEGLVSRGMLAVMLCRAAGGAAEGAAPFSDVPDDAYYAEAVAWGHEAGILNGMGDGTFAPDRPVNRQELAKILAAYCGEGQTENVKTDYADQNAIDSWAKEAVARVTALGLMEGSTNGCFNPMGPTTRAAAAAVLLRLEHLE